MDRCRVHDGANRHVLAATSFRTKFACANANVDGPANTCTLPEPILDANWHAYVAECLAIAPMDGPSVLLGQVWHDFVEACTAPKMPNWDYGEFANEFGDGYEWMRLLVT